MANGDQPDATGWMSDVQRALALILVGSFAIVTLFLTMMAAFWSSVPALTDMAKASQSNLTNMCLIGLGFFFGNTMAKMAQDKGQQEVVNKLTSSAPPATGPVAPLPAPVVILAWWSLLTPAEQSALTANAANDPRVQAFVTTAQIGKASPEDLTYLVGKGLLTQDRATAIAAT